YLCNLTPHRFEAIYSNNLPDAMSGEAFLTKYDHHNDPCHYSYSACGLGSDGTDRLVQLVQEMQHRKPSVSGDGTLYGAKITGGGSGGTICVIGRNCLRSSEQIL
nr:L-arabinokinase-like isoform X1 [Tanacetum cinerariifolium]